MSPAIELLHQDYPLLIWLQDREVYLQEMLRLEGRGEFSTSCLSCGTSNPTYMCKDCFGQELYCGACIRSIHIHNPLHSLKVSAQESRCSITDSLLHNRTGTVAFSSLHLSRTLGFRCSWAIRQERRVPTLSAVMTATSPSSTPLESTAFPWTFATASEPQPTSNSSFE